MGATVTRRTVLRSLAGASAAATGSAAAGSVAAQEGGQTHTVDMTDELVFDPDSLTIAPGDTVVWENVGQVGHTVTAYEDQQPDGTEYWASADVGSESAARSAYPAQGDVAGGESYQHTFDVVGTHSYFCIPHESVGMVGDIVVQEGGSTPAPTVLVPQVPNSAKSLAIATGTVLSAVLALAYFFMKYGGDYGAEE